MEKFKFITLSGMLDLPPIGKKVPPSGFINRCTALTALW